MSPEDIDKLTIAEVRAINERAGEALKALADLGIAPQVTRAPLVRVPRIVVTPHDPAPESPYPCALCGRATPITPQEQAALGTTPPECGACGNPMAPVGPRTNKGHPTITAAQRAAKLAQPAFDANGEPT